jgi:predicted Zn-dependent protease
MRRFFLYLLITILVFTLMVGNCRVMGQSQDTYSVQLQGWVWGYTEIQVLVINSTNESWWDPNYLNATVRAIGQWNDAFSAFAENYSDFSYLSSLKIEGTVSSENMSGFDIYVNYTQFPLSNISNEVGLSTLYPKRDSTIDYSTISLATHTIHGDALSVGDMQNIALHEFGHSLGLGHSNYAGDLMYASYSMSSPAESVSTLDAYGVATLFAWKLEPSSFYPVRNWLVANSAVLPSNIPYVGLPVSQQNVRPQTAAENPVIQVLVLMFQILIHPEVFSVVLVFIIVFVLIALIPRRRKSSNTATVPS